MINMLPGDEAVLFCSVRLDSDLLDEARMNTTEVVKLLKIRAAHQIATLLIDEDLVRATHSEVDHYTREKIIRFELTVKPPKERRNG